MPHASAKRTRRGLIVDRKFVAGYYSILKLINLLFIKTRKPILTGILVFAAIAFLTQLLAYQRYLIFKETQRQKIIQEANFIKDQLKTSLSYSLSATKTLAFIVDRYGVPKDFDSIAFSILEDNKFIDALQLTRKGVITHVYPFKGNEVVIGYDIFKDTVRNREAFKALEKGELYFAGPFELVQGGTAVVGRLPIFKDNEFFGFSVVLIKLETLLRAAGLLNRNSEFTYQISKVNPYSNREQFFIPGVAQINRELSFSVEVPDGEWKLYVIPNDKFYQIPAGLFISVIGLLLSLTAGVFAWYLVRQPQKLNRLVEEKASEVVALKRSAISTIERVSDAFVSLDRNWNYTYLNQKAGEIFGRDPREIIGKNIWQEFPEGVGQPFYHAYHKALHEQKYIYLEEYYEPYDKWFENHVYPSPDGLSIYFRDVTESKKAAQRIEASEKYFRALFEKSADGVVLFDSSRKLIYHSPSTEQITGYSYDELHNHNAREFLDPSQVSYFDSILQNILDKPGNYTKTQFQFRHKKGYYIWIEGTYTNWLHDPEIKALVFNYRDITERAEAEEKIKAANRLYHFTSSINQMMIHAQDEKTVYEQACKTAVEVGQFIMAWIGTIDKERNVIVPISYAGNETGYISAAPTLSLNDPLVKEGPTAQAIRRGKYFYCNDIENDPAMKPWAGEALGRGFRASIALPIKKNDEVVGIFHIYSEEKYCFDENEILLLEETTRNISFTLQNLEREELRRIAEKQIEHEKILSDSIINSLPGVFYMYDREGTFVRWNKNFESVTGYNFQEISAMTPLDFFDGEEKEVLREKIVEVFLTGRAEATAYFTKRNGDRVPYYFNGTKITFGGIDYLIGMGIDISHRVKVEQELIERTEEIQKLTGHLQNIREEERTHIAREIHDVIGQQLTALKMDASWLKKRSSVDTVLERITGMISLIDETIKTVRRISSELRPVMLDDLGLGPALEWQISEFEKNTGITTNFQTDFAELELEANLATNIFRIVQEALTNISRHAGASKVDVRLQRGNGMLHLTIKDNGIGFDQDAVRRKKSLGLIGMRERARMYGGQLYFQSNEPTGIIVQVTVPLKSNIKIAV